jgi:ABC-type phosphate/phosphonate transport system substrate-binding protein
VYNGQAAGGAIYEGGIQLAFTDAATKKVDLTKVKQLKVIAVTDPIPNGMIVTRANIDSTTLANLKQAFADINSAPDGKAALASVPDGGWNKIVAPDDKIFDSVRKKATILGLSLKSLDSKK